MDDQPKIVRFDVEMTTDQAREFAQFLKRVSLTDYRERARNDDEAYAMMEAGEQIRDALKEIGYAPR